MVTDAAVTMPQQKHPAYSANSSSRTPEIAIVRRCAATRSLCTTEPYGQAIPPPQGSVFPVWRYKIKYTSDAM